MPTFRTAAALVAAVVLAAPLRAQGVMSPADQIASAVLPLPAEFRATATVLGYSAERKLVTLREGTGAFTCLASDPARDELHVACYHKSMEPFMARGRALRASGVRGEGVDSARYAEVKAGTLKVPAQPAALYSLTGGKYDAGAGTAPTARSLYVIYIPGATAASTGITDKPTVGAPWIMFPGTPKAHIMFVPRM
jgi:hypothetical protein